MYEDYEMKTEVPEDVILTDFAEYILKDVEHTGSCVFDIDDGTEDWNTLTVLTEICGNVGYSLISFDTGEVNYNDSLVTESRFAGRYIVVDEMAVSNEDI